MASWLRATRAHAYLALSVAPLAMSGACVADEQLDPAAPSEEVLVGAVGEESDDTRIAVALSGDAVIAYSCGGDTTYATNTHWFDAALDVDGAFDAEVDGWRLEGVREGTHASGVLIDPTGRSLAWRADDTPMFGPGGLYMAPGDGCSTGVIVRPGDDGVEVRGSSCDGAGIRYQVTPVRPEAISASGFAVWVRHGAERLRVQVERVTPE